MDDIFGEKCQQEKNIFSIAIDVNIIMTLEELFPPGSCKLVTCNATRPF
jgi:hypothetical protein